MSDRGAVPFRWDVTRREQLGGLPDAPVPLEGSWSRGRTLKWLVPELRECTARVVARAGDARWVLVGRSPESLHDYLSGVLDGTGWLERLAMVNVSLGDRSPQAPAALQALRTHLDASGLSPRAIAWSPHPVAFVDLVCRGRTFGALGSLLDAWARDAGEDPAAVRRRLRWVGMTARSKNSPNTWRWFQRLEWTAVFPRDALRGVSIPYELWTYLGDWQPKTVPSNHAGRWGDEAMLGPSRDADHLAALGLARALYERGRAPEERARFAALLARRPEMREAWLRRLVLDLRRR